MRASGDSAGSHRIGCWGIQKKTSNYSKFSLAEDEASQ